MPPKRRRNRDASPIVIESSSEVSEASEDNAPEFDVDSPSKHGGLAAQNDVSERHTMKINSGSFGMFNRPMLYSPRRPRTPEKGTKKKRVKEYSEFQESSRSGKRNSRTTGNQTDYALGNGLHDTGSMEASRRTGRKSRVISKVIEPDMGEEDAQCLFIPEMTSSSGTILADDDSEDEEQIYNGMTPERAQRAKDYIRTLDSVESVDRRLRDAENQLEAAETEHTTLSWKLTTIDATADDKISDIIRERDEAIKLANEHAETKIRHIKDQLPVKKEGYERRLQESAERKKEVEERILKVRAEAENTREAKAEMERQGGFQLGIDVTEIQSRSRNIHK